MSATITETQKTVKKVKTPAKVSFASITPNNLGTLRKLNLVLFPIKYTDRFYKDVLLPEHENYCKLVYFNDIPVGTICCRIEKGDAEGESKLYIMTMGVLAPYRSLGLGTQALQHVVAAAHASRPKTSSNASGSGSSPLKYIYLHVQTSNSDAKRFYERNGFVEVGKIDGYYKKIEPHDAWVLQRALPGAEDTMVSISNA
ncbi:hypothetical protein FRC02_012286 [Tulasnella sp. 418]|nr:hypothetical protein FRC02_012286 [Tulasnella sp. 418]